MEEITRGKGRVLGQGRRQGPAGHSCSLAVRLVAGDPVIEVHELSVNRSIVSGWVRAGGCGVD